jgi:hypothetical protein
MRGPMRQKIFAGSIHAWNLVPPERVPDFSGASRVHWNTQTQWCRLSTVPDTAFVPREHKRCWGYPYVTC